MHIISTEIYGFRMALEGMRNPRVSHDLIDSEYFDKEKLFALIEAPSDSDFAFKRDHFSRVVNGFDILTMESPQLGPNDLKLCSDLIGAGEPHCKFLRQIQIWTRFKSPRYKWQDDDTYKVATVRNSFSSRHSPRIRDWVKEDFEGGEIIPDDYIELINEYRRAWVAGDNEAMLKMKRLLPESFLQEAHYTLNYSTALNMLRQRFDHPLPEYNAMEPGSSCQWLLSLPYMQEFLIFTMEGFIRRANAVEKRLKRFKRLQSEGMWQDNLFPVA